MLVEKMLTSWCCCCREEPSNTEEVLKGDPPKYRHHGYSESDAVEGESTRSHSSSLTPEEKEREKTRLQKLVKDFIQDAVRGIPVCIIDTRTGTTWNSTFRLEMHLEYVALTPFMNSEGEQFRMKEVTSVCKGKEVLRLVSVSPESLSGLSVGVFLNNGRHIVFTFKTPTERDRFYTCFKILRMTVEIGSKESSSDAVS